MLDETPHSGTRRVTFVAAQPPTLTVDDISAPLLPGTRSFIALLIEAPGARIALRRAGDLEIAGGVLTVRLR
jgi:hypothetical protein